MTPILARFLTSPEADGSVRAARAMALPLAMASVAAGVFAGRAAASGTPVVALLVPVLLVPVAIWSRPRVGLYLVMAIAVIIDQFALAVGPREGPVTGHIPLLQGVLPAGVNPTELVLLFTALVVVMQSIRDRRPWLHASVVRRVLFVLVALVAVYLVLGVARGGNVKMALWEVRPFAYLVIVYLLAVAVFESFADVRPLLWIVVLGSGAKAAYGLTIFMSVRHVEPRPEAVLAHEESFFFGLFIVLTVAMWLYRYREPVRWVATLLLPVVLLANMVNSRRTAWLILMAGLAVLGGVALVHLREHRRTIAGLLAAVCVAAAVYLPVFWDKQSTLAQPARAVRSAIAPDPRDDMSNDYRMVEDYNLYTYIGASHSTGVGFGQRISYFGLVDLTEMASALAYVPHNGVLYVWLRMGLAGIVTFALFVSQAAISAARLAGARNRQVAMIGAVTVSILFGYVAMGGTDMGFFWFRNALAMGMLVGAVDGLSRAVRAKERGEREARDALSTTGGADRQDVAAIGGRA